jgi:hypothetical protein
VAHFLLRNKVKAEARSPRGVSFNSEALGDAACAEVKLNEELNGDFMQ